MARPHNVTHPLLLLLFHNKPRDSIPLNQHKKEKQRTTQECAGHYCEVIIKNKLILLSAHGLFFFFSWRSVLQSTNLPIKHYVKPPHKQTHAHTHKHKSCQLVYQKTHKAQTYFTSNCPNLEHHALHEL